MWNHCQSTWTEWAKAKRELEDKFKSVLIRLFHCNVLRYYYGKWFSFCTLHAMTRTHYSLSYPFKLLSFFLLNFAEIPFWSRTTIGTLKNIHANRQNRGIQFGARSFNINENDDRRTTSTTGFGFARIAHTETSQKMRTHAQNENFMTGKRRCQ